MSATGDVTRFGTVSLLVGERANRRPSQLSLTRLLNILEKLPLFLLFSQCEFSKSEFSKSVFSKSGFSDLPWTSRLQSKYVQICCPIKPISKQITITNQQSLLGIIKELFKGKVLGKNVPFENADAETITSSQSKLRTLLKLHEFN